MTSILHPIVEFLRPPFISPSPTPNLGRAERIGTFLLGSVLAALGARQRSLGGGLVALFGSFLVMRATTGDCPIYRKLQLDSTTTGLPQPVPGAKGFKVEQSIWINRPAEELYRFWRQLENLPRFMPHLESVDQATDKLSHWRVKGPAETHIEWDAEIINEHPGQMISWRSVPGGVVESAGSVWFQPEGSGTRVKINLQYRPVGGAAGVLLARFFGETPDEQIAKDLRSFKELLERGEHHDAIAG